MNVIYDSKYNKVYTSDPAAAPGRMECIYREIKDRFQLVQPHPASVEEVALVHSASHIDYVRSMGLTYEIALLAAGGAIAAAEQAVEGEACFGLIRPPGHHASQDDCWGFCFFNNIAISVAKLREEGKIRRAVILDIDLHYGDGTANIFAESPEVTYFHPDAGNSTEFIDSIDSFLGHAEGDIIAVSAGFDRHREDWGMMLDTQDYRTIGVLLKEFALRACGGRRYGVLEGGYNHTVLGQNVKAFLEGME
ncbi:histone deacetylase family protein [Chloroflexota bacterium]